MSANDGGTGRSMTLSVGQVLEGKYELTRKLGEGGMGAVYEAMHARVGRRFAIKFLHPELVRHPDILARFRREARAAGSLRSEHVVAITDFGETAEGAPFIVMEFLIGEELRRLLLREGPLPVPRAVNLMIQACRGLAVAHAQGIVHRDLKPENMMLCKRDDGTDLLKIVDFGIAKLRSATTSGARTAAGSVIGTLFYMPPEQVRGDASIDERADIYALGCILYELLSGRLPHPGDESHAIMFHIMFEPAAPLGALRALPEGLAEVVHRALAPDANARFPDVKALANALAPFAGRQVTPLDSLLIPSVSPYGPTAVTPVTAAAATPPPQAALSAPAISVPARLATTAHTPGSKWPVVALVLLALAGAIFVALQRARPQPSEELFKATPVVGPVVDAPNVAPAAQAAAPEPAPAVPLPPAVPSPPAEPAPAPPVESKRPAQKKPPAQLAPPTTEPAEPPAAAEGDDALIHRRGRRVLEFSKDNPYQ